MRKPLSLLLVLCMFLPACTGAKNEPSVSTVQTSATEAPEPEYVMWQNLPQKTFDGYEFRFIEQPRLADTGALFPHGDAEELTGEVINDAIYNRNLAVETRFDTVISTNMDDGATATVLNCIRAGDDQYSAVMLMPMNIINVTMQNGLRNLYNVEGIDLSNPWYNQLQVEKFTIHDKLYYFTGDVSYSTLMFGACMIYNVDLGVREGLENIHDIVVSGNWTLDKMYDLSKGVARDLNGDGVFKESDDQFVYAMNDSGNLMNFQYSSGEAFVRYDKKAEAFVDIFNVDRMQTIVEKIIRFYHDENRGLQAKDYTALFNSGRLLLRSAYVGSCVNHREMEDTFTPIPYPKFNTDQEQYYSMMTGSVLPVGIPTTVQNTEATGVILEALSEHSAGDLNRAVYEQVLAYQTMRDEDAYEILRLIHAGLIVDIGYLTLSGSGEPLKWIMGNLVVPGTANVASFYEQYKNAVAKFYEEYNETFLKLE